MNEMRSIARAQAAPFRARFTTAEFERLCASGALDNMPLELVDGELERMQSPNNLHAMRQAKIVFGLAQALGVEQIRGSVGIDLGYDTVLECDAAVLREPVTGDRRLVAADMLLVIEVAQSTRARDLGMKRTKYAAAGIAHYWVVDGERGVVHVHAEPVAGDYAEIATVRFGQPLAVPGTDATTTIN